MSVIAIVGRSIVMVFYLQGVFFYRKSTTMVLMVQLYSRVGIVRSFPISFSFKFDCFC